MLIESEMKIEQAKKRLKELWDSQGDCRSCGWHGALYEHDVTDYDIQDALENNKGILELECVSKNDEEGRSSHRGISIYIGGFVRIEYTRLNQLNRAPLTYEELESMKYNTWNGSEQLEKVRHQLLDIMDAMENSAIVPLEPTEIMIATAINFQGTDVYKRSEIINIYKEMLAVTPCATHV